MKKLIYLLFIIVFFVSCGDKETKNTEIKSKNVSKKIYTGKLIKNIYYKSDSKGIIIEFYEKQKKETFKVEDILNFEPNNIKGTLKWISEKELLFSFTDFEEDTYYKVLFSIKNYLNEDYKDISFGFSTFNPIIKKLDVKSNFNKDKFTYTITMELNEKKDVEFVNSNVSVALVDNSGLKKDLQVVNTKLNGNTFTLKTNEVGLDVEKQLLQVNFFNQKIEKKVSYNINGLKSYDFKEKNDKFKLYLYFSENKNLENVKDHITIDGVSDFFVNVVDKTLVISGDFKSNTAYNIRLFAPLGGMTSDEILTLTTPNLEPSLEFKNDGIYLAKIKDKKIRIRSRNIENVNISLKRVNEDNIAWLEGYYGISSDKKSTKRYEDYGLLRYGTEIYNKKFAIDNKLNTWTETDIDLVKIIEEYGQKGLFLIQVSYGPEDLLTKFKAYPNEKENVDPYSNYYYSNYLYYNGLISKGIILSDIGIISKKVEDRIFVYTQELSTGKELEGVKVSLWTYNNMEKIAYTNEDGVAIFDYDSFDEYRIKAEYNDDFAFLSSSTDQINYGIADNSGIISEKGGLRAYMYTERGVYRPGDKVYTSAILFEKGKELPANQNLVLKIITPQGKKYKELRGKYIGESLYTFEFETKEEDISGNWLMELYLGEKLIKKSYLKIENIVPPRIKVKNDLVLEGAKLINTINAEYLFGAPGSNLKYESNLSISTGKNTFKNYKNYSFVNELYNNNLNKQYRQGTLTNEGNIINEYDINIDNGPFKMNLTLVTDVFQSDGRKVTEISNISYDTHDYYVGVERFDSYYKRGDKIEPKVVIVDKNGELLEGELTYNIYKNETYWWWDYSSYDSFKRSYKKNEDTLLIDNGKINSGEKLEVNLDEYGEYYVEVIGQNGHKSGTFIKAGYYSNNTNRGDTFNKITLDKKEYSPGERVLASIESPSNGVGIVSIEDGKNIIETFRVDINKGRNDIEFVVKEEYLPGVYVNIIILQKMEGMIGEEIRLQGLEYVKIFSDKYSMGAEIEVEDLYTDSNNIQVKIDTSKGNSVYTLAVVDEGLLALTKYQSPNAYNAFFSKEKYSINNMDNYGKIINFNSDEAHKTLIPGGGYYDEVEFSNKAIAEINAEPNSAKRIKSTSKFYTGKTDEDGKAIVNVDLDEYMGQVRFMLVATKDGSFAAKSRESKIRSDVVLEEGLPRVLTPGDKLTTTLDIFVNKEMDNIAFGGIRVEGPIRINSIDRIKFDSSKSGVYDFKFQIEALSEVGIGKVIYYYESEGFQKEKVVEISVASNAPYQEYTEDFQLESNKNKQFKIQEEAIKGSGEAKILVSREPLYNLYGRLNYLIRYPYGCLEQTTSTLFAQLNIDKVLNLSKEELTEIDKNMNEGIRRLEKFMLPDGSLAYWESSTTTNKWGSSYAYYFLVKAKNKGYYVSEEFLDRLKNYLKKEANNTRDLNLTNLHRLYVLSLDNVGNINAMNYYKQNKLKDMSNQEKFLLAGSYANLGYKKIANSIIEGVSYEVGEREWDYDFGSELRDKAIILDLSVILGKEDTKELYNEIMSKLASKNWYSTQTIAYSLVAISNYLDLEKDYEPINYEYVIGNKVVRKKLLKNNETIDLTEHLGKEITITNTSNEKIYFSYNFSGKMKNEDQVEFARGIKLSADYYDRSGNKLNDFNNIKQGEDIWVIYRLNKGRSSNYMNMALYQNLPSGLEIENQRISNYKYPDWLERKLNYKQSYSNMDIRDDKVVWFFDWYYGNEINFVVKLNSVTTGEFYMPGAVLEGMYTNEIGASLKGNKVIIK